MLDNSISELGYSFNYVITASDVVAAICKLKRNKNDGCAGLSTNHLKHATPELFVHISCSFSGTVLHGSVPNDFLSCTAVPIPKGRNVNFTDSTNYRGISLSSVLGKVFDLPRPREGDGVLFSRDFFLSFFVSLSVTLRKKRLDRFA